MQGLLHGHRGGPGVTGRPHDEMLGECACLPEGEVYLRLSSLRQVVCAAIADHSHDLELPSILPLSPVAPSVAVVPNPLKRAGGWGLF